jgi:hypothetical protein
VLGLSVLPKKKNKKDLVKILRRKVRLGMVAEACNPGYLGGGDQEDWIKGQQGKTVLKTPSQPIKVEHSGISLL